MKESHKEKLRAKFYKAQLGIDREDVADWWFKEIESREKALVERIEALPKYYLNNEEPTYIRIDDIKDLITNQE